MAVLVGSKQLARVQGDDAQGHVTKAMFSLPEGDDDVAADARHTLDTLGLAAVIEAWAGGQRLVLASARGPGQDGVDVIWEVLRDYGWELLAHGTHSPKVARWPQPIAGLPVMPDGRPILHRCPRGRKRGAAYSVLAQHARWRVLCSDSRTHAAMYGRTCGRSVVIVAAIRRGLCFRSDATGAERQGQFGSINVPPSHYAGHVRSVPIGGGLRRGGHCGTLDRCPQVPGRQSRVT